MSKDHIALPKSSLLRFSNNGQFWYLDLQDDVIKRSAAKTYNTAETWYPYPAEQYLSTLETKMGRLAKSLADFRLTQSVFTYPENMKDTLITWIAVQSMRHPDFAKQIRQKSILDEIAYISPDENRWFSPLHLSEELIQKGINIYKKYLNELIVNTASIDENCVLTWCLTPEHYFCHNNSFFFPLSPYDAVALTPRESYMKNPDTVVGNKVIRGRIGFKTDNDIEPLMKACLKATAQSTIPHLVGLKPCLEKLQTLSSNA